MSEVVLTGRNLTKRFEEGTLSLDVLHGVSLEIHRGEFVAIVGSSGSGKTTLMHLLGGLDRPTGGEVLLVGQPFSQCNEVERGKLRNRHIGFVYQFHHLLPEFTALENVCMPLLLRDEKIEVAVQAASELLDRVGLKARMQHKPSELSGGERQRVAMARALVTRPSVVLADEPTGNLDHQTSNNIQALLHELNSDLGISFVTVTHDVTFAARAQRIIKMESGRLAEL